MLNEVIGAGLAPYLGLVPSSYRERLVRWIFSRLRSTPLQRRAEIFVQSVEVRLERQDHGVVTAYLLIVTEKPIKLVQLAIESWSFNGVGMLPPILSDRPLPSEIAGFVTIAFSFRLHAPDIERLLMSVPKSIPRDVQLAYQARFQGTLSIARRRRTVAKQLQLSHEAAVLTVASSIPIFQ